MVCNVHLGLHWTRIVYLRVSGGQVSGWDHDSHAFRVIASAAQDDHLNWLSDNACTVSVRRMWRNMVSDLDDNLGFICPLNRSRQSIITRKNVRIKEVSGFRFTFNFIAIFLINWTHPNTRVASVWWYVSRSSVCRLLVHCTNSITSAN